jgi:hypothetical protein
MLVVSVIKVNSISICSASMLAIKAKRKLVDVRRKRLKKLLIFLCPKNGSRSGR